MQLTSWRGVTFSVVNLYFRQIAMYEVEDVPGEREREERGRIPLPLVLEQGNYSVALEPL